MDRIIEKKILNWKKLSLLGACILACSLLVVFFFMSFNENSVFIETGKLRYSTVKKGEFSETVPFRAEVMPKTTVYLDTQEGGKVMLRHVEAGDFIKEGEPIITLINTQVQLDVIGREALITEQLNNLYISELALEQNELEIERLLAEAEHQLKDLTYRLESRRRLAEKNMISAEEIKLLESELVYRTSRFDAMKERQRREQTLRTKQITQLKESLKHLDKNLLVARGNLDNLIIKAPIDGQLSQLDAEIGSSISSGQRLGQVDVVNEFKVQAYIDEYFMTRVRVGQMAEYIVDGKKHFLKLLKIYPSVQGGQFMVDFEFVDEYPASIARGQTFQANLQISDSIEVALLERGGFFQDTGGAWAFVLNSDKSRAVRTEIALGRRNHNFFEVISGLDEGDTVVISSYGKLIERDVLKLN